MKLKKLRDQLLMGCLTVCMLFSQTNMITVKATESKGIHINVLDYGADPTGIKDSTDAIWDALQAAKVMEDNGKQQIVLDFPKGEYHIYKDHAQVREYHTSNTNSIQSPNKTIGILIEEHKNLTINGNDSLFMMHGNMMALAVVKSENIVMQDFSWDFAVPTVSEMTIMAMGNNNGKPYTDFYIPACFPYEIKGSTIQWNSEKSPYTGKTYWSETGIHNAYSIVAHMPEEEMTRAYFTSDSPFTGVSSIETIEEGIVRITYNNTRPAMQQQGMILELASSAYRETAGAFTWESKNVVANRINVHFMHGFGWLIQMSTDVEYHDCNFMPRENSGHMTVGYADLIHASGAAGELVIEGCNFSNSHDDPINLHGTFTRVEQRQDDHTVQLKYIHTQQGGFPQFHIGDKVAFFTRDTLESTDKETFYTVAEVISNPGENGNDLRTMVIRFEEALPTNLSDKIGNEPKYVAENVTYAPAVTIRDNTFKNVPTRGILCTTRNKVVIEGNTFLNMSMATIYLSNDSDEWYESGPIRDLTIRNNTFYIKSVGRTSWEYAPAIYVHPVTKGGGLPSVENPIHKNITIEGNEFYMDVDTVVKAESVENLTIRNNKIWRTNPAISIQIESDKNTLGIGESLVLNTTTNGDTHVRAQDNIFEFTKCKNVILEGNTYDDGLKKYAVLDGMDDAYLINKDNDIKIANNRNEAVSAPVNDVRYASSDPAVLSIDAKGKLTAKKEGSVEIYAYYEWNGTIIKSNKMNFTVSGNAEIKEDVNITTKGPILLQAKGQTAQLLVNQGAGQVIWSVSDFLNDGTTSAASISAEGIITANKNGIVWVKASNGVSEDQLPVVISLPQVEGLSPAFTIIREDNANYTTALNSITIDLQKGDLYNHDNTVKNLFLYSIPQDIAKDYVRTIVKVDNLPVNESGQWDTASFLLYHDDDHYISIGKKSHYYGITSVYEQNGNAVETGGNAAQNAVTTAYLGFTKIGNNVSLDFRLADGNWTHAADIDGALLQDDFQIGFAGWETNDRGKKVTFSDFKIESADTSYAEMDAMRPIAISGFDNKAPILKNVHFEKDNYTMNDNVQILYDFEDADQDQEGTSLYVWSYMVDGKQQRVVTDVPQFTARIAGALRCEVYPLDEKGTPGIPIAIETQIRKDAIDLRLDQFMINGKDLLAGHMEDRDFNVLLPEEMKKIEVSYHAIMSDEGSTQLFLNDKEISPATDDNSYMLTIKKDDIITVKRSQNLLYQLQIHTVADNTAAIERITMDEMTFETSDFTTDHWWINTKTDTSTIEIMSDDSIERIEILEGEYRKPLTLSKTDTTYQAQVHFVNGLNTYYVVAFAKDGSTKKQYMINILYQPETTVHLKDLKVNSTTVNHFQDNIYEYAVELSETQQQLQVEAVSDQLVYIRMNDHYIQGNSLTIEDIQNGSNQIYILLKAKDGITRAVYHIEAIRPYAENTDVLHMLVDDKNIMNDFDEENNADVAIADDHLLLDIATKDSQALISVSCGNQKKSAKGKLQAEFNLYEETPYLEITITARDGKTTTTYHVKAAKKIYLSDLNWREDSTIGYGTIQRDAEIDGIPISLADENGKAVTFAKGLGTHAESFIYYDIKDKGYERLQGFVGIDYSQYHATYGDVQFQIFADDRKVFDSGVMLKNTSMKAFDVEVKGAETITLKALMLENNWNDHADWADIQFTSSFPKQPAIMYTQTINPTHHGSITANVEGELQKGSSVTYTFIPEQGYHIERAMINDKDVSLIDNQYTIESVESVQEDITVDAVFAQDEKEDTSFARGILKNAIDKTLLIQKSDDYAVLHEVVKALIDNKLTDAETAYNDEHATNESLLSAWLDLANALHYVDFKADKSDLKALITMCEALDLTQYNVGIEAFRTALAAANEVFYNESVLQESIDEAFLQLSSVKEALRYETSQKVNKDILAMMIALAEAAEEKATLYKQDDHWAAMITALKEAKDVFADENTKQDEVNSITTKLANAYEQIRLLPNEDMLKAIGDFLAKAEQMNRSYYHEADLNYVDSVLEKAKQALNGMSRDDYEVLLTEMLKATNIIEHAIHPDNKDDHKPISDDKVNDSIKQNKHAKTGDTTNASNLIVLALLAGAVVLVIRRKKVFGNGSRQ